MKKKHFYHLIPFTLATAAVLSLAGCSASSEDSASGSSESAEEDIYNAVVVWPNVQGKVPEGLEDVEAAINEITIPEIGVSVTLEPMDYSNLASETSLAISGGDKLDLVLSVKTGVSSLVNNGSIIELDELYQKYGSDITEACGDAVAGGYYNGKLYGIPNAYIQGEKYGYLARTDILDKYGITADPNKYYTLEDLEEIFATVKAGEGDGFYMLSQINSTYDGFAFTHAVDTLGASTASGILLLDDNWDGTTIVNQFETEAYKKYAETMYRWAQAGYISPDAASNTDSSETLVQGGNYLGKIYYTTGTGPNDFASNTGYPMTVFEMLPAYKVTSRFQNILWSIPITSENPEKAFQLLNLFYGDNDLDVMLQFGLEGKTYEVVEENEEGDKVIRFLPGLDSSTAPYYQNAGVYGNRLTWPVFEPNPVDINKQLREFNASITDVTPALGYCFVTDNVQSEYAAVQAVINQYIGVISAGAIDPALELPEFNQALKDAGIDTIIAENQRQLDEWLASQQ